MNRARGVLVGLAAGMIVTACGDELVSIPDWPMYNVTPSAVTLAVGDTASVVLEFVRGTDAAKTRVDWSTPASSVIRIDSIVSNERRVRIRAVANGEGSLQFLLVGQDQTWSGTVPVHVTAARDAN